MLVAAGFLAKSLINNFLERDLKRFEATIKATHELAVERLKSDLHIRAIEHEVRFSRLHEKRAEVIAELNGHFAEALWEAESFLSPMQWANEPSQTEKHRIAMMKLAELYRFFDKNRIYLPAELGESLKTVVTEVRSHVIKLGSYLMIPDDAFNDDSRAQKHKIWIDGWEAIRTDIPQAREKLEAEFRLLLGPSENPSSSSDSLRRQ